MVIVKQHHFHLFKPAVLTFIEVEKGRENQGDKSIGKIHLILVLSFFTVNRHNVNVDILADAHLGG